MIHISQNAALSGAALIARAEALAEAEATALFAVTPTRGQPADLEAAGLSCGPLVDKLRRPLKGFDVREGRLIQSVVGLVAEAHVPDGMVLSSYRVAVTDSDQLFASNNRHLRDLAGFSPPKAGQEIGSGEIDVLVVDPEGKKVTFIDIKRSARPEDNDMRKFLATALAVRRRLQSEGLDGAHPHAVFLRWFPTGFRSQHIVTREAADEHFGWTLREPVEAAIRIYRERVEQQLRELLNEERSSLALSAPSQPPVKRADSPVNLDAFRRALGLAGKGGRGR